MNDWTILLLIGISMSIVFAGGWAWCNRLNNYSPVDAFWAFGIGICTLAYCVINDGDLLKRVVTAILVSAWSLRLGWHLQARIRQHHPEEDSRYEALRAHWEGRVESSFFWFFQAQAFSVILLSWPYFLISGDSSGWGAFETVGLLVTLVGLGGETLADSQMKRFKKGNHESSAVCQEGLWRYSRHPNYFFEFVIWVGLYLFACGSSGGWLGFYAPAIILFLLLKVTGIKPTEESAVRRKGDAYREYQRTTSAFIPLPRRKT